MNAARIFERFASYRKAIAASDKYQAYAAGHRPWEPTMADSDNAQFDHLIGNMESDEIPVKLGRRKRLTKEDLLRRLAILEAEADAAPKQDPDPLPGWF